jgi:SAM-dependent methyltransferase
MGNNLEKTAAPWKAVADMWNAVFAPPSRIYPGEVRKYSEWLSKLKKNGVKALVLGATPELRDILAELGYEVTILDINNEMIQAMTSLLKVKNPKERVVVGNWLENPLPSGSFDLVIGDAVLPNVMWEERTKLLREVHRVLRPNGVFVTRAFLMPKWKWANGLSDVLKRFKGREPTSQASLEFVVELQSLAYTKDHLGTFTKPKEMLETIRKNNSFDTGDAKLNRLLDMVWDVWCTRFIKKVFTYAYRDVEEAQYREFFTILEAFNSDDSVYCEITPMYILEKER